MINPQDQDRGQTLGTFRLPRLRWAIFGDRARSAGTDRSKVLNEMVAWYNREPGARLPKRPAAESATA
jgi:hypothetical protein